MPIAALSSSDDNQRKHGRRFKLCRDKKGAGPMAGRLDPPEHRSLRAVQHIFHQSKLCEVY
jgi:hypothetical protein